MRIATLIRYGKNQIVNHYPLTSFVSGAAIQKFIDDHNNCDLASTAVPNYLKDVINNDGFFISSNY